ncbi:hypothetical protein Tcan_12040 [Toxocara canis]|uniref:Uncharacterized protein n=1 Tax=Toxocara canis TaxID=6265 RepID=A0A0B2UNH3_TOXCA|nr:hypothetical protein Tcan_12040 [Toxocara canis]
MQNTGGNPNQPMYYQQSQGGGGMGMAYPGMGEQQRQQSMMGMQGGMMTSSGGVPSQQMYGGPMQGVPQRTYGARVQQVKKEEMFEAQRQKLVRLSSALKSFEWMCSVSDPRLLKKPEKF